MQYRGAKWLKVDLHVHTPFDRTKRFTTDGSEIESPSSPGAEQLAFTFFDACSAANLDVVALTDHNSIEGYSIVQPHLSKWRMTRGKSLTVLPGVEFTVGGERILHVLLIASDSTPAKWLEGVISNVFANRATHRGREPVSCQRSLLDFNRNIREIFRGSGHTHLLIPAHVNRAAGIATATNSAEPAFWEDELRNHVRERAFAHGEWAGFQVCGRVNLLETLKWAWAAAFFHSKEFDQLTREDQERIKLRKHWPFIEASDPNCEGKIGQEYTWLKMTNPTLEGVRLALLDPESRLRSMADGLPGEAYPTIESIRLDNSKHVNGIELHLSRSLSTFIGGRGSGKSTLLEFARWGLDRNREQDFGGRAVYEKIGSTINELFQAPKDAKSKGLFETGISVTTRVRVQGHVYDVVRNMSGIQTTRAGDNATYDVRQLIAPRIFSQRQIAAIAEDPAALRSELDALLDPEDKSFEERKRTVSSLIEELQRRRDVLEAERSALPAKQTDLQITTDHLALLENAGNRDVLSRYTQIQRENAWFAAMDQEFASIGDELTELATAVVDRMSKLPLLSSGGPFERVIGQRRDGASVLLQRVSTGLRDEASAMQLFRGELARFRESEWLGSANHGRAAYDTLKAELAAKNIDFGGHEKLVQRKAQIEAEIQRLQESNETLKGVFDALVERRAELVSLHSDRVHRRRQRAEGLSGGGADIEILLIPYGDRDEFRTRFTGWIAGSGFAQDDWEPLEEFLFSNDDGLPDRILRLITAWRLDVTKAASRGKTLASHESEVHLLLGKPLAQRLSARFLNSLMKIRPSVFNEAERYLPEDLVEAKVRQNGEWKALALGSLGQKATAILGLIVSRGTQPILIDQPEDDLDNRFIYDVVVDLLRKRKFDRQIVVATHNANIPVNGDAELIVSLQLEPESGRQHSQVSFSAEGSIDIPDVKKHVSDIMEGSVEAFNLRRERYGY